MTIEERVQQLIEDGGVIQIPHGNHGVLELSLGAAVWLSRPARLRWGGIFPEHQGHVHEQRFDEKMFDNGERDVLLRRGGRIVAAVVPYDESGLPADDVRQAIAEWQARLAVPGNQEQFEEFFEQA